MEIFPRVTPYYVLTSLFMFLRPALYSTVCRYVHSMGVGWDAGGGTDVAAVAGGAGGEAGGAAAPAAAAGGDHERTIGAVVALYLTTHMFLTFDHPPIVNTVAAACMLGKPHLGDSRPGDVETLSFGLRQMMIESDRIAAGGGPDGGDGSARRRSKAKAALQPDGAAGGAVADAAAAAAADAADSAAAASAGAARAVVEDGKGHDDPDMSDEDARGASVTRLARLLDCTHNDVVALQVLALLHALTKNQGIYKRVLELAGLATPVAGAAVGSYDGVLVPALLRVIEVTARADHCSRLSTLGLAIQLALGLTMAPPAEGEEDPWALSNPPCLLTDEHRAIVQRAYDLSVAQLSAAYNRYSDAGREAQGQFLDLFEIELKRVKPVKVRWVCVDL